MLENIRDEHGSEIDYIMVIIIAMMMMFWQIALLCLLYLYVDKRIVDQIPGYLNDLAKHAHDHSHANYEFADEYNDESMIRSMMRV